MWPFTKTPKAASQALSLEQALRELESLGVTLAGEATITDLPASVAGGVAKRNDRVLLLCALGDEAESPDVGLLSDDIWHVDAECIEDHGDYARLAERFGRLTRGRLALTEIVDHVEVEAEEAWLEFTLDGQRVHWDFTVDNDWMDPAIYSNFQKLLATKGHPERFMICALGQDSLILCGTEEKRKAISQFSGLDFQWE